MRHCSLREHVAGIEDVFLEGEDTGGAFFNAGDGNGTGLDRGFYIVIGGFIVFGSEQDVHAGENRLDRRVAGTVFLGDGAHPESVGDDEPLIPEFSPELFGQHQWGKR